MQSLDSWVSAGDICEDWPCDPWKNALKVGGKLPFPLHYGLQDGQAATQQTQTSPNARQYHKLYFNTAKGQRADEMIERMEETGGRKHRET